jgi:hypothetical protein
MATYVTSQRGGTEDAFVTGTVDVGSANGNKVVVAVVANYTGDTTPFQSSTLGGLSSAGIVAGVYSTDNQRRTEIIYWDASALSGSQSFTINATDSLWNYQIDWYVLDDCTLTPVDTASDGSSPMSADVSTTAGDIILAIAQTFQAAANSFAGEGWTEYGVDGNNFSTVSGYRTAAGGTETVTVAGTNSPMSVAVFAPAGGGGPEEHESLISETAPTSGSTLSLKGGISSAGESSPSSDTVAAAKAGSSDLSEASVETSEVAARKSCASAIADTSPEASAVAGVKRGASPLTETAIGSGALHSARHGASGVADLSAETGMLLSVKAGAAIIAEASGSSEAIIGRKHGAAALAETAPVSESIQSGDAPSSQVSETSPTTEAIGARKDGLSALGEQAASIETAATIKRGAAAIAEAGRPSEALSHLKRAQSSLIDLSPVLENIQSGVPTGSAPVVIEIEGRLPPQSINLTGSANRLFVLSGRLTKEINLCLSL